VLLPVRIEAQADERCPVELLSSYRENVGIKRGAPPLAMFWVLPAPLVGVHSHIPVTRHFTLLGGMAKHRKVAGTLYPTMRMRGDADNVVLLPEFVDSSLIIKPEFTAASSGGKAPSPSGTTARPGTSGVNNYHGERRLLHRITIEGEKPS
jgi:hypothetical protein